MDVGKEHIAMAQERASRSSCYGSRMNDDKTVICSHRHRFEISSAPKKRGEIREAFTPRSKAVIGLDRRQFLLYPSDQVLVLPVCENELWRPVIQVEADLIR
jgi:hypothetical protein